MNLWFRAKTNKSDCMINSCRFHLKNGGTITVDRTVTTFSIENGLLEMEWEEIYLWAVNECSIFEPHGYFIHFSNEEEFLGLIKKATFEFELEEDAGEDYVVENPTIYFSEIEFLEGKGDYLKGE